MGMCVYVCLCRFPNIHCVDVRDCSVCLYVMRCVRDCVCCSWRPKAAS